MAPKGKPDQDLSILIVAELEKQVSLANLKSALAEIANQLKPIKVVAQFEIKNAKDIQVKIKEIVDGQKKVKDESKGAAETAGKEWVEELAKIRAEAEKTGTVIKQIRQGASDLSKVTERVKISDFSFADIYKDKDGNIIGGRIVEELEKAKKAQQELTSETDEMQSSWAKLAEQAKKYGQVLERVTTGKGVTKEKIAWENFTVDLSYDTKSGELLEQQIKVVDKFGKETVQVQKAISDARERAAIAEQKLAEATEDARRKQTRADAEYAFKQEVWMETYLKNLGEVQKNKQGEVYTVDSLSEKDITARIRAIYGEAASIEWRTRKTTEAGLETVKFNVQVKDGVRTFKQYEYAISNVDNVLRSKFSPNIKDMANRARTFGTQFADAMGKVLQFGGAAQLVNQIMMAFRDGFERIKTIDKAMVNLQKVTDETGDTYRSFEKEATRVGNSLGATTSEVIDATTEFARLGYTLEQAKQLARESLLYSNVGDIDVETASQSLISTIKGFGIAVDQEGENVRRVVDMYNEVGNNFAISSAGIGEALRRSAASLAESGNTLAESIGMVTAANAVIQDPAVVGTALKTIAMRMRGVNDEGEEMANYVPELQKQFDRLGISLVDTSGNLRSTYDVLDDLAKVWGDLDDMTRADLLERLAGKRQGNILAAMLKNWQDAQDAMSTALNSTGSAARENEKYMQSIEAKMAQFSNAINSFWQKAVNSEAVKGLVSIATAFVNGLTWIIDKIGILTPIIIGLTLTLRNLSPAIYGDITAFFQLGVEAVQTGTKLEFLKFSALTARNAVTGLAASLKGLMMTTVVGAAISALTYGVIKLVEAFVKWANHSRDLYKANKEALQTARDQEESLAKLEERFNALSEKTILNAQEQEELNTVKSEMAQIMPEIIAYYDAEGNAVYKSTQAIKDQIKAMKERNIEAAKNLIDDARTNPETRDDLKGIKKALKDRENLISDRDTNRAKSVAMDYLENLLIVDPEFFNLLTNDRKKIREHFDAIKEQVESAGYEYNDQIEMFIDGQRRFIGGAMGPNAVGTPASVIAEQREMIGNELTRLEAQLRASNKTVDSEIASFKELFKLQLDVDTFNLGIDDVNQLSFLNKVVDEYSKNAMNFNGTTEEVIDGFRAFLKVITTEMKDFDFSEFAWNNVDLLKMLREEMARFPSVVKVLDGMIAGLEASLIGGKVQAIDFGTAMRSVVDNIATQEEHLETLAEAYVKVQEGQALTAEEISKLIEIDGSLIDNIIMVNGHLSLQEDALYAVMEAQSALGESTITTFEKNAIAAKEMASSILGSLTTLVEGYREYMSVNNTTLAQEVQKTIDATKKAAGKQISRKEAGQIIYEQELLLKSYGKEAQAYIDAANSLEKLQELKAGLTDPKSLVSDAVSNARDKGSNDDEIDYFVNNDYEDQLEAVDLKLKQVQNSMIGLAEYDEKYSEAVRQQIALLQERESILQAQANDIERRQLPEIRGRIASETDVQEAENLKKEADSLESELNDVKGQILDVRAEISEITAGDPSFLDPLKIAERESEASLKAIDAQIAVSKKRMEGMSEISKEYIDELTYQNSLYADKMNAVSKLMLVYKEEETALVHRLETEVGLSGQARDAVEERLETVRDGLESTTKEYEEFAAAISDNEKDIAQAQKDWDEEAKKIADKAIDIYKDIARAKKEAIIKGIEDEKDAENDRHKVAMQNLEDELDYANSVYDERLRLLDEQESQEDFDKEYSKELQERSKIQAQIDALRLDDSAEGQAKLADLQKKLDEKNASIEEMLTKRQRDLRRRAIEDERRETEKSIENRKRLETDSHDKYMEDFDKRTKAAELAYEQDINNFEKMSEIRENIMNGEFEYLQGQLDTYFGLFDEHTQEAYKNVKKIFDLAEEIKELSGNVKTTPSKPIPPTQTPSPSTGGSGFNVSTASSAEAEARHRSNAVSWFREYYNTGKNNTSEQLRASIENKAIRDKFGFNELTEADLQKEIAAMKDEAMKKYIMNKIRWQEIFDSTGRMDTADQKAMTQQNEIWRKTFEFADFTYEQALDWAKKMKWIAFDTGGYTGTWGRDGRMAVLHEKELVLNQKDTKNILATVDIVRNMIPYIKKLLGFKQTSEPTSPSSITVEINIERMIGDRASAENLANTIATKLKSIGVR